MFGCICFFNSALSGSVYIGAVLGFLISCNTVCSIMARRVQKPRINLANEQFSTDSDKYRILQKESVHIAGRILVHLRYHGPSRSAL